MPKISFIHSMSEPEEQKKCDKGYVNDVLVEFLNGRKYRLCFYDPVRLMQDVQMKK